MLDKNKQEIRTGHIVIISESAQKGNDGRYAVLAVLLDTENFAVLSLVQIEKGDKIPEKAVVLNYCWPVYNFESRSFVIEIVGEIEAPEKLPV